MGSTTLKEGEILFFCFKGTKTFVSLHHLDSGMAENENGRIQSLPLQGWVNGTETKFKVYRREILHPNLRDWVVKNKPKF